MYNTKPIAQNHMFLSCRKKTAQLSDTYLVLNWRKAIISFALQSLIFHSTMCLCMQKRVLLHHKCSLFQNQPMLVQWRNWRRFHHCFCLPHLRELQKHSTITFHYNHIFFSVSIYLLLILTIFLIQGVTLIKVHFLWFFLFVGEHQVQVVLFQHLWLLSFNFQLLEEINNR